MSLWNFHPFPHAFLMLTLKLSDNVRGPFADARIRHQSFIQPAFTRFCLLLMTLNAASCLQFDKRKGRSILMLLFFLPCTIKVTSWEGNLFFPDLQTIYENCSKETCLQM